MRKVYLIFFMIVIFIFLGKSQKRNFQQTDTSPSFKINNEWIEKDGKRFFPRIVHYFYVNDLQEYSKLKDRINADSSLKSLSRNFNVIIHPWWLFFVAQGDSLKLGLHNCENPAFNLNHPKAKYPELKSNNDAVLMTPMNAIRKVLQNAGLDSFGMSSGYFNEINPIKTYKNSNKWVMGPDDMRTITDKDSFVAFFGNDSIWGYYQNKIVKKLMQHKGEFFWGMTDEPDKNGHNWFMAKEPLEKIYKSLTRKMDNIVFQSLSPVWNGNKYLFAKNYPNLIPVNNLTDYKKKKYLFSYESTFEGYQRNLTETIQYYKKTGNVFGINDYVLILKNPEYAGYFVDWIKSETDNAPVIIWVAPYQIEASFDLHNCQMFTAIVHGANGIGFWLQETTTFKYDRQLLRAIRLSREIQKYENIITAEPDYKYMENKKYVIYENDIHYTVKKSNDEKNFLIAVNTSKSKEILFKPELAIPGLELIEIKLEPLQVVVF